MLSGMLDIYLSSVSYRLNEVMKVLTIIATIFMPLTFLAGVYGMNFKFMPELEWRWAFFVFRSTPVGLQPFYGGALVVLSSRNRLGGGMNGDEFLDTARGIESD